MGLSINNVSMDYFLRGVDAAKPSSSDKASSSAKATEDKPVDTAAANAGKLVSQLDVLLMKAAKASTKSLDGKTVKQTFQKLVVMQLMKPIARHRAFDATPPTIGCVWLRQLHNQLT